MNIFQILLICTLTLIVIGRPIVFEPILGGILFGLLGGLAESVENSDNNKAQVIKTQDKSILQKVVDFAEEMLPVGEKTIEEVEGVKEFLKQKVLKKIENAAESIPYVGDAIQEYESGYDIGHVMGEAIVDIVVATVTGALQKTNVKSYNKVKVKKN